MNKLIELSKHITNFVNSNFSIIILVLVLILVIYLGYKLTFYTLGKLKSENFSYYPFDKFFPKSGKWSVTYFLVTIFILGILVFLILKGNFRFGPA